MSDEVQKMKKAMILYDIKTILSERDLNTFNNDRLQKHNFRFKLSLPAQHVSVQH